MEKIICLLISFLSISTLFGQMQKGQDLIGNYPSQQFGKFLELSNDGESILIGSTDTLGAVKLFQYNGMEWELAGAAIFPITNGINLSDISLSGDGTVVAIGGLNSDNDLNSVIEIFKFQDSSWVQYGNVIELSLTDFYFAELSNDGSRVVVGTPWNSDVAQYSGLVRVYELQDSVWIQIGQDINGYIIEEELGLNTEISDDGNRIAVHARQLGPMPSHIELYEFDGENWILISAGIEDLIDVSQSFSFSKDGSKIAFISYETLNRKLFFLEEENENWIRDTSISINGIIESFEVSKDFKNLAVSIRYPGNVKKLVIWRRNDIHWSVIDTMQLEDIGTFGNVLAISGEGYEVAIGNVGYFVPDPLLPGIVRVYEYDNLVNVSNQSEIYNGKLEVSPNPVSKFARINVDLSDVQNIRLFDRNGVEIKRYRLSDVSKNIFDFSELVNGIYYLTINDKNGNIESTKFIKID